MGMHICNEIKSLLIGFIIITIFIVYPTQDGYCYSFFRRSISSFKEKIESKFQSILQDTNEENNEEKEEEIVNKLNFLNRIVKDKMNNLFKVDKTALKELNESATDYITNFESKINSTDFTEYLQELRTNIFCAFAKFEYKINSADKITNSSIIDINKHYDYLTNKTIEKYKTSLALKE